MSSPRNLFVFICLNLNSQKLKSGTRPESKVFSYSWSSLVSGPKHGLWTPTAWIWIPSSLMTICVTLGKLLNFSGLQFLHWSKEENCACVLSRFSCVRLCVNIWNVALQAPLSDSLGKNTGVGCHVLLQGVFPTQGSNSCLLCLLHWQAGSLPLALPGKLPNSSLVKGRKWYLLSWVYNKASWVFKICSV